MTLAATVGVRFADLLIPRLCAGCGIAVDQADGELCITCAGELADAVGGPYCARCGEDRQIYLLIEGQCTGCRLRRPGLRFDRFVKVGRYTGALRSLVLRFKKEFVLDRFLGKLLAAAIGGRFDPGQVDCWVPVPSHWWRRLSTGFRPTDLLARAVARALSGQVVSALAMTRYVRPFHLTPGMSAAQRSEAIKRAFRVPQPSLVVGRTVCIIDDVTTTGATLGEARRALRAAGAARILAAVVAKTAAPALDRPGVDQLGAPD